MSHRGFFGRFFDNVFVIVIVANLSRSVVRGGLSYQGLQRTGGGVCYCKFSFVPLGLLFLYLKVLLVTLTKRVRLRLPTVGSSVLPVFTTRKCLKGPMLVLFAVKVVTTTFDGSSSTLATVAADMYMSLLGAKGSSRRITYHGEGGMRFSLSILLTLFVYLMRVLGGGDMVSTVCVVTSCACNPLLKVFTFNLFAQERAGSHQIPLATITSPLLYCILS